MNKLRKNPEFAACGLNCGLCPRYYTVGSSRCPGCAGEGFTEVHPTCGILSCCQRKGIEFCFECNDYPCKKYEGADLTDSFITHRNQISDMEKAKNIGIGVYIDELKEKMILLEELLQKYDDGRRKGYYCLSVNLLELSDIKDVMEKIDNKANKNMSVKEKAKIVVDLFNGKAEEKGITLKLRK